MCSTCCVCYKVSCGTSACQSAESKSIDRKCIMQEAVAGFQPKGADLDYPGKLQRLAEQPQPADGSATATEQTPLVGALASNGDASSLVSPCQPPYRSKKCLHA